MPGFGNIVTPFRGFPHWYQLIVRADGEKLMKNWNGRQVIDVDEWRSDKEKTNEEKAGDEGASTVLVPPAGH